jgi:hypothetical protein
VRLAADQVVLGVANGWAGRGRPPAKALFLPPRALAAAHAALASAGRAPRGWMLWSTSTEGLPPPPQRPAPGRPASAGAGGGGPSLGAAAEEEEAREGRMGGGEVGRAGVGRRLYMAAELNRFMRVRPG